MEIIATILAGIIIAAASSWITVQLSLRRFRQEKWWERRIDAYERILEALHHSKAWTDTHLNASYDGNEVSEERDKELRIKSKEASREIEKAIDIGGFLLGDEARKRLKQFQKDEQYATDTGDWNEHLQRDWEATNSCLEDMIIIAKNDLKTK